MPEAGYLAFKAILARNDVCPGFFYTDRLVRVLPPLQS